MGFTRNEESPVEDDYYLSEEYIPEKLLGRDEELEELNEVFQQIIDLERPINTFIYGMSGTGKTVSIRNKQKELKESIKRFEDVHATFIYQNCEGLNSSYQAAISIINSLLGNERYDHIPRLIDLERDSVPENGLSKDAVYTIFFDLLDALTYENLHYREQLDEAIDQSNEFHGFRALDIIAPDKVPYPVDIADRTGKRAETVEAELRDTNDIQPPSQVDNYVVVILDEVDQIGSKDELLYKIPRSRASGDVGNIKPSIIGISNSLDYQERVQSKTSSSLRDKAITFRKYHVNQLEEILHHRAELAFKDDGYTDAAIHAAATYGTQQGGDARYALDVLTKAAIRAKRENETTVTKDHVQQAHEEKQRNQVLEVAEDLTTQEKVVLAAVTYHTFREETPVKTNTLYNTYKRFVIELEGDEQVNTNRSVGEYLKGLSQARILNRIDAYKGPGDTGFKYELDRADYDTVYQALVSSESRFKDTVIPDDLRELFEKYNQIGGARIHQS